MVFGSAWVAIAGMIDWVVSIGWAFNYLVSLFCTKYMCNISSLQVHSVSGINLSISKFLISFSPCHCPMLEVSTIPFPQLCRFISLLYRISIFLLILTQPFHYLFDIPHIHFPSFGKLHVDFSLSRYQLISLFYAYRTHLSLGQLSPLRRKSHEV
jgi:hypothetical protein